MTCGDFCHDVYCYTMREHFCHDDSCRPAPASRADAALDRLNESIAKIDPEATVQFLYEALGVSSRKDALSAITGLKERVRFTEDFETLQLRLTRLREACSQENDEVCQLLGKVLGYPWFKDDQANFPGATEADGVCVGDNVAVTMAMQAAHKIEFLQAEVEVLRGIGCGEDTDGPCGVCVKCYKAELHYWLKHVRLDGLGDIDLMNFRRAGRMSHG
jgi:hypothetical protein